MAATLAAAAPQPARAADYSFDPTHTTVHVELPAAGGLSTLIARLAKGEGTLTFDRAARSGRVEFAVQAGALDSGVPALDALLRGPGALDAATHPLLRFVGDTFRFDGDRLAAVAGTLTVKGREAPLTLNATRFNCYTSPLFRREVCGGDFEARIDRAALGLGEGAALLRVQVEGDPAVKAPFLAAATRLFVALAVAYASAATHAQPVDYMLDPERSFVHFEVVHFSTSTSRGRFGPLSGSVVLDRTAGRGEVSVRVPTATVSTGIPVFDAVLRGADLLSSTAHPEAFFVARSVRFDDGKPAELRGEFTLRGVSQGLTLRALAFGCRTDGTSAAARETCGGDFEGEFSRSEFGITHSLPFVADRVRLRVQVEGRRQ